MPPSDRCCWGHFRRRHRHGRFDSLDAFNGLGNSGLEASRLRFRFRHACADFGQIGFVAVNTFGILRSVITVAAIAVAAATIAAAAFFAFTGLGTFHTSRQFRGACFRGHGDHCGGCDDRRYLGGADGQLRRFVLSASSVSRASLRSR
jgi:hypothetical protein